MIRIRVEVRTKKKKKIQGDKKAFYVFAVFVGQICAGKLKDCVCVCATVYVSK